MMIPLMMARKENGRKRERARLVLKAERWRIIFCCLPVERSGHSLREVQLRFELSAEYWSKKIEQNKRH